MTDTTPVVDAEGQDGSNPNPDGARPSALSTYFATMLSRSDAALALGVICILVVLILPMPTWLLDFSLALSITFSVLILMTVLFIKQPLELSAFPIILLIATMLRFALNLASTRLILADGHTGTAAAGQVIEAFGGFVMRGNFVIGIIIFGILVIVNFVVITKGATRVAEVAARFSLDAMPGKQMAIDADLSSGLISEDDARSRRKQLEAESSFYGAMDGASKFVRGDAIAGLLITFINIVGGIIIGVAQQDLTLAGAAENYTVLTVGDGLVSQIPALIVSTSAGLLVTKTGLTESAGRLIFAQLGSYSNSLGLSTILLVALAVLPGIPAVPFLTLALLTGGATWVVSRRDIAVVTEQTEAETEAASAPLAEEPISASLQIDSIRLELGYGLLSLINTQQERRLTDQIKALRRQLAIEVGFVMPAVRIQDNLQLASNSYIIKIKEIEAGRGELRPNMLLVMDPRGETLSLPGEATTEPTFGLPAMWINDQSREEAMFRGYTVVDAPTVITTHLTEVVKDNMSELLSFSETQKLLDEMDKTHQKLVTDLIPTQISVGGVQRALQNLLRERVSIRDLATILEGISEACGYTRNIMQITEHVRARLSRQLSDANVDEQGVILLATLSPEWEQTFMESIVGEGDEKQLSMQPSKLQQFINTVRQKYQFFAQRGESPALLVSPLIRPYVRSIIERFRPITVVMSQNEIYPKAKIKTVGQI